MTSPGRSKQTQGRSQRRCGGDLPYTDLLQGTKEACNGTSQNGSRSDVLRWRVGEANNVLTVGTRRHCRRGQAVDGGMQGGGQRGSKMPKSRGQIRSPVRSRRRRTRGRVCTVMVLDRACKGEADQAVGGGGQRRGRGEAQPPPHRPSLKGRPGRRLTGELGKKANSGGKREEVYFRNTYSYRTHITCGEGSLLDKHRRISK